MISKISRILFFLFSFFLLLYLVWPFNPSNIEDFSNLPESVRSKLSGDTTEVPDLKAFFSFNYRDFVIPYYIENYKRNTKFPFSPLRLNHPPEEAFTYIKDQTHSTYLEELTYPMRSSLFINGLEPFNQDTKDPRYPGAVMFGQDGKDYETKVVIRYYYSTLFQRIIGWLGINLSVFLIYLMFKKVILKDYSNYSK